MDSRIMRTLIGVTAGMILGWASSAFAQAPTLNPYNLRAGGPGGLVMLDSNGSAGALPVTPHGATVPRGLAQKLGDRLNLMDFGAKCDGATDDSPAVTAAAATKRPVEVPAGASCLASSFTEASLPGVWVGPGKILTNDDFLGGTTLRAPNTANILADPNPTAWTGGAQDNCTESFNCNAKFDYSHQFGAEEMRIFNLGAMTGPGYRYYPGTAAHSLFYQNFSGGTSSPTGNGGRTGLVAYNHILQQDGGGDLLMQHDTIECNGSRLTTAGANITNWAAAANCTQFALDMQAQQGGQYLEGTEYHFGDSAGTVGPNGQPQGSTVYGHAWGYTRNVDAPADGMDNRWVHQYMFSGGPYAVNAGFLFQGRWGALLDGITFASITNPIPTTIGAVVAMAKGQRIYLNGTGNGNPENDVYGGDWFTFDPTSNTVQIADAGAPVVEMSNPASAVNHLGVSGAVTGGAVTIAPVGSDAFVPLVLGSKGAASLLVTTGGAVAGEFTAPFNAFPSQQHVAIDPSTTQGSYVRPPAIHTAGALGQSDLALHGDGGGLVILPDHTKVAPIGTTSVAASPPSGGTLAGTVSLDGTPNDAFGTIEVPGNTQLITLTFGRAFSDNGVGHAVCVLTGSGGIVWSVFSEPAGGAYAQFLQNGPANGYAAAVTQLNYQCR